MKPALRFFVPVLAVLFLLPSGCKRAPSTWKEWIDIATLEFRADHPDKAFDACNNAYEAALKEGSPPQVIAAYECLSEAAAREGKAEKAFPMFRTILTNFDRALLASGGALRLRNNHAVALVRAGDKAEGVEQLEEALDAYEGTPNHSKILFRVRMLLVANLARTARVFTDESSSVRVSSVILDEILNHLENERYRKNVNATVGTGDALAAIADLVRIRGDPKYALELSAMAKEQIEIEDDYLEGQARVPPCEQIIIRSLVMRRCYSALK